MADYSEQQLIGALRKADAAGDVAAAKAIARRIQSMRQAVPAKADFSGVTASVDTTADNSGGYKGQLLAPSSRPGFNAPSLEQTNAQNRAYAASPQFAEDKAKADASQMAARQQHFQAQPLPVRALVGAGSRVAAAGRGIGQLGAMAMDAVSPVEPTLSGLITGQPASRYDQAQAAEAAARENDRFMEGDTAATVGGVAGDLALMAVPASKLSKLAGASRGGQLLANVAGGAAFSGAQPIVDGESRGVNAALGGTLGAAGTGVAAGLSKLGQRSAAAIDPLKRELAEVAKRYNIPLHASQVSNSLPAKVAASAGKYLPFSGGGKAAANQQGAFNAALGETFGVKGATRLSDDVVKGGQREISKTYDEIFNRNDVALDKGVMDELKAIQDRAARSLPKDDADVVSKNIDYVIENSAGGKIPGRIYQSLRGDLSGSSDKMGRFLGDIRKALDGAAERSVGPQDAAALKQANSQWANLRTVQDALKQAGGAAENVNPANLWNLVRKGSTKDMRDLARLGQVVLKDPIPDSGTAQRGLAYALLGGGAMNPAAIPLLLKSAAAGATVGRAANSPGLANFMLREGRGQGATSLAKLVRAGTPAAAPAAANEVNKKRNTRKDER